MEFRDAGKSYGKISEIAPATNDKYYPSLEIDLLKFPELSEDIGEECVFMVRGIVKSKTLSDNSKCQYVEIRSIGVGPEEDAKTPDLNEADKVLAGLKSPKRY